jgi:hypothetical protein
MFVMITVYKLNELNKFFYLRRSHATEPLISLCDRVHRYSKLQFSIAFTIYWLSLSEL